MWQARAHSACVTPALQNTGTSLLECFDAHAIHTHVTTTYEHAQSSKTPAQMPVNPGDECKVCGLTKLTFEPPCIYCTTCGQRIKRGQTYHCTAIEPGCEFRGFWCHGCLQEQKGDRVAWEGSQVGRQPPLFQRSRCMIFQDPPACWPRS